MPRQRLADLIGVIRGMQVVANYVIKCPKEVIDHKVKNSSFKTFADENIQEVKRKLSQLDPSKVPVSFNI